MVGLYTCYILPAVSHRSQQLGHIQQSNRFRDSFLKVKIFSGDIPHKNSVKRTMFSAGPDVCFQGGTNLRWEPTYRYLQLISFSMGQSLVLENHFGQNTTSPLDNVLIQAAIHNTQLSSSLVVEPRRTQVFTGSSTLITWGISHLDVARKHARWLGNLGTQCRKPSITSKPLPHQGSARKGQRRGPRGPLVAGGSFE